MPGRAARRVQIRPVSPHLIQCTAPATTGGRCPAGLRASGPARLRAVNPGWALLRRTRRSPRSGSHPRAAHPEGASGGHLRTVGDTTRGCGSDGSSGANRTPGAVRAAAAAARGGDKTALGTQPGARRLIPLAEPGLFRCCLSCTTLYIKSNGSKRRRSVRLGPQTAPPTRRFVNLNRRV